tara:strand:+ start:218 stop:1600 length:1383 start_codon:yes stop_codon:yes gene_type:complete
MSKVFKRPMFRRGGNVGTGIMTGIVDRSMHAENPFVMGNAGMNPDGLGFKETPVEDVVLPNSNQTSNNVEDAFNTESFRSTASAGTPTSVEDYISQIKAGAGEYGGMDPLTSYLLTAGPQIAKATSFGDAISRLEKPNAALIESQGKKAAYDRDLRLAATKMGIADKNKFEDRQFQLDAQADQRRFDRLIKTDDREWKSMLIKDERDYLDSTKLDDREWKKYLIGDARDYEKRLLTDRRDYEKLTLGEKQAYDEKLLGEARSYQDMKDSEKREYEKGLIADGRIFELEKITRKEKFEEKLIDKQLDQAKLRTSDNYLEFYGRSDVKASNRADYENNRTEAKLLELFGKDSAGLIGGDKHGSIESIIKGKKKKNIGKVFFDITDGTTKRIRKNTDGSFGIEIIDPNTFVKEVPISDKEVLLNKKEKDEKEKERLEKAYGFHIPTVIDEIQKNSKTKEDISP